MDKKARLLIQNIDKTVSAIEENKILKNSLKKEIDKKIRSVSTVYNNKINPKEQENRNLNDKINNLKEEVILKTTLNIDTKIQDFKNRLEEINDKENRIMKMKENTILQHIFFQKSIKQWVLLPIWIICGCILVCRIIPLVWISLILVIGSIVFIKKLLQSI